MALSERPAVEGAVRRRLARTVFPAPWVALAAVGVASLVGVTIGGPSRYVPLLVSVVFLGLPHGALDHVTVSRARGSDPSFRALAAVGALYLVLGGLYAAVWFVAPVAAFVGFLLLTWVHWGQGDVYPLVSLTEETHLRTRGQRALAAAVRGGIPMVVPLVGFPETYRRVAATTVELFAPGATFEWLVSAPFRYSVGVGLAVLTLASLLLGWHRSKSDLSRVSWLVDVGESALLWAFFLVVPPLVAIGLYFPIWHSLRHLARLAALDSPAADALSNGRSLAAAVSLGRDALPMTAGAVVFLGALAVTVPTAVGSIEEVASVYLVSLAVLTLPHVVVVSVLDRIQGVW